MLPRNPHSKANPACRRPSLETLEGRVLFAAGDLDGNFGVGGIARADFGTPGISGLDVAAAGSRIYAAGYSAPDATGKSRIALAAFDGAGRPDRSLGGDGTVLTTVTVPVTDNAAVGEMLVQSDGKILVLVGSPYKNSNASVLARFNPDGTPDTSFGGGDAKVELDVGKAMALAPGGKIVVSGAGPAARFAAVRLNPDGSFDSTFDGDGKIVLDFGNHNDTSQTGAADVAVMNDGRIVLVGAQVDDVNFDGWLGAVARLNPDGSYDNTFSGDGRETYDFGWMDNGIASVATGPRGEVLIGTMEGEVQTAPIVLTGSSTLRAGTSFDEIGYDVPQITRLFVQPDGKVVVSGRVSYSHGDDGSPETLLARYNPDGSFDPTFAHGHVMRLTSTRTALAPNGDVVALAGSGFLMPYSNVTGLAVARYLGSDANNQITRLQAEGAISLNGAIVSRANAGSTGAGYVDFINDSGAVADVSFYAYEQGSHELRIRYANGSHRVRFLKVGLLYGGSRTVAFHPTGSWSTWREQRVTLDMASFDGQFATQNVITFETTGRNGPNIDRIDVVRPPAPAHLQAEDATLSGAAATSNHTGYEGSGFADFVQSTGSIEWTVNAATAGWHNLTVRYANGDTVARPMDLSVNGGPAKYLVARPTGMWANWATETIAVDLVAGANRIRLSPHQSPGPNVDWIMVI
jgi:uncharacterized delta-60 repeat protein